MERLTTREEYPHGAEGVSKDRLTGKYCRGTFEATACVERLAEYENAEADGRLLELPCRVGDTVHFIDDIEGTYERSAVVTGIEMDTEGIHIVIPDDETGSVSSYYEPEEFGKTIFLTREAAEAALKEMEERA